MAYTIEEEVEELKFKIETLEVVIKDIIDIFIDSPYYGGEYNDVVNDQMIELKKSFDGLTDEK